MGKPRHLCTPFLHIALSPSVSHLLHRHHYHALSPSPSTRVVIPRLGGSSQHFLLLCLFCIVRIEPGSSGDFPTAVEVALSYFDLSCIVCIEQLRWLHLTTFGTCCHSCCLWYSLLCRISSSQYYQEQLTIIATSPKLTPGRPLVPVVWMSSMEPYPINVKHPPFTAWVSLSAYHRPSHDLSGARDLH